MTEITKETISTKANVTNPVVKVQSADEATSTQSAEYSIYFVLSILETLLAFRLILKMMGASATSGFVSMIYGLSGIFIMPFEGIFRRVVAQGIETTSVVEPSNVVAMIVYAVLAFGIVKFVQILSGEKQTE